MKDFLLLFRGGLQFQTASPDEIQQHMLVWKDWMDQLSKEGRVTGGERLTGEGATIRGEQRQVTDGPFAEGKEVLGGYFSIKAHNLQDAIQVAMGCPIYRHQGSTEVREVVAM